MPRPILRYSPISPPLAELDRWLLVSFSEMCNFKTEVIRVVQTSNIFVSYFMSSYFFRKYIASLRQCFSVPNPINKKDLKKLTLPENKTRVKESLLYVPFLCLCNSSLLHEGLVECVQCVMIINIPSCQR